MGVKDMKSTMTMVRGLLLMSAALGLILACGGDEEPVSKPAPTPRATQAESPPPAEAQGLADTEMPPIPPIHAQTIAEELSVKIEMPDFYPSDGPVYPNTPPSKAFVKGDRINLMFGTNDGVNEVLDFLNADLPRLGWNNAEVERMSNIITIQATKPGRTLAVILTSIDSGKPSETTLIAISLTGS